MHSVELAWRQFRTKYPHLLDRGSTKDTVRVVIAKYKQDPLLRLMAAAQMDKHVSTAALGSFFTKWRDCHAIYTIEPKLGEQLLHMKFPESYPVEHLRVPRMAFAIDCPSIVPDGTVKPSFYFVSVEDQDLHEIPGRCLAVSAVTKDVFDPQGFSAICLLQDYSIATGTLGDCLASLRERVKDVTPEDDHLEGDGFVFHALRMVLNFLLYIQHEDDIVRQIHPGAKPVKKSNNPERERRYRDLQDPEEYLVGAKYARVIEQWEIEQQATYDSNVTGRSVKPHFRAPHPHLYWTGAERKTPIVKYLGLIAVKGGGDPDVTRETKVR